MQLLGDRCALPEDVRTELVKLIELALIPENAFESTHGRETDADVVAKQASEGLAFSVRARELQKAIERCAAQHYKEPSCNANFEGPENEPPCNSDRKQPMAIEDL